MGNILQTRITYKKKEGYLHDYVSKHSSPSTWIKDLIRKEYENEQNKKSEFETITVTNSGGFFDLLD